MKRSDQALKNTAFHEAGHAVEAFGLKVPFRSVTIRPGIDSVGHVLFCHTPNYRNDARVHDWYTRRVQVALAGQIAEAIHMRRKPARYKDAADNAKAISISVDLCGSSEQGNAWLNWLFLKTRDHLRLPHIWHEVECLAHELLKREILSGTEAQNIIESAFHAYGHRRRQFGTTPIPVNGDA